MAKLDTDGLEPAAYFVPIEMIDPWEDNPRDIGDVSDVLKSITRFGFGDTTAGRVLPNGRVRMLSGHRRLEAAIKLALPAIPMRLMNIDEVDGHLFALAANKIDGTWSEGLAEVLADFDDDVDLTGLGWDDGELEALLAEASGDDGSGPSEGDDDAPGVQEVVHSTPGEVYELGPHRLICGDSTKAEHIAALMQGDVATMAHADPPFGMGKEAEGVANDNLRGADLDAFQMAWWSTWRPFLADDGSAYIWGVAADLWRLWYVGGLQASEDEINVRNEITWAKGDHNTQGMRASGFRRYPAGSERCLFLMMREQSMGSINADRFPESAESLRAYLDGERAKMGWGPADTKRITGTGMHSHWFSRSQWALLTESHYEALQAEACGAAFLREYDALRAEYDAQRGFFDNTHDSMSDVWAYPSVQGEERAGHPTPKPVAMVQRAIRTSSRPGDVVAIPFGGSGPDLIACEKDGRVARVAELEPKWCDVIRRRYTRYAREHNLDPGPGAL